MTISAHFHSDYILSQILKALVVADRYHLMAIKNLGDNGCYGFLVVLVQRRIDLNDKESMSTAEFHDAFSRDK